MKKIANKPTMLFYGDSPEATTGLGRLHRYLLKDFMQWFDITFVAVNHHKVILSPEGSYPIYDQEKYPIKLISTYPSQDVFCLEPMAKILDTQPFDYIFTSHDMQNIMKFAENIERNKRRHGGTWINYTPIDRKYVLKEEMGYDLPDKTITLSKYGMKKIKSVFKDVDVDYIHHPLYLDDFPEVEQKEIDDFKKEYFMKFGTGNYKILANFNRNQPRKDLVRTCLVYDRLRKKVPNLKLYLHTKAQDVAGDLTATFLELGLNPSDVQTAHFPSASSGVKQEILNLIYRSCDVGVSTSTGEGFGYTTVEYFATKLPTVVPDNTSFTELVGENEERGLLAECNDIAVDYGFTSVMRDRVSIDDMVKKLEYLFNHPKETQERTDRAYKFVETKLNPEYIAQKWKKIFSLQ